MKSSSRPIPSRRYKWLWLFVALAALAHLTFLTVFGLTTYRRLSDFWNASISQAESAERWSARLPTLEEAMQRYGVIYREISAKKEPFKREFGGTFLNGSVNMKFENDNGLEEWSLTMTARSDHIIGDSPEDQALVEMTGTLFSALSGDAYSADFIEEYLTRITLDANEKFMPEKSVASSEAVGEAETFFGPFFVGFMTVRVHQLSNDFYITHFYIRACTGTYTADQKRSPSTTGSAQLVKKRTF